MKYYLLLLAFIATASTSCRVLQSATEKQGMVTYKVLIKDELLSEEFTQYLTFAFHDDLLLVKVQDKNHQDEDLAIINRKDEKAYFIDPERKRMETISISNYLENIRQTREIINFIPLEDSLEILGYNCSKVAVVMELDMDTFKFWVTDELPGLYTEVMDYLKIMASQDSDVSVYVFILRQVGAFPLSIEIIEYGSADVIMITAIKMSKLAPIEIFDIARYIQQENSSDKPNERQEFENQEVTPAPAPAE